jgi:NADH-quinone oxidoreductase subunit E
MLSEQLKRLIDRETAKYPADQKQSAVIAALTFVQREHGWVAPESERAVADYLGMPVMAVHEVVTFYNMFNTKPVGKCKISVCTNLPCALSGGVQAADYLKQKLGIGFNETTADGQFTLVEGECMGACGDAPVMLVNDLRMCSFMSAERIDQMLADAGGGQR